MVQIFQESLFEEDTPLWSSEIASTCSFKRNYYTIENKQESESTLILFARHQDTQQEVVIKVLRKYKDTRYSLLTVGERQQCQLEALQWNQKFTPKFYHGLGPILEQSVHTICIGEVSNNPKEVAEKLDSQRDYALIMNLLKEDRRLDLLLQETDENALEYLLGILTRRIAYIHTYLVTPTDRDEDGMRWGSLEQLEKKLEHNIGLLELVATVEDDDQYRPYYWLKDALREVIKQPQWPYYLEHRIQEQQIKRCHGDLKATNIWINSHGNDCQGQAWQCVKILDAIDFNPAYSNIDVLSDVAMLVVDIQARTKSSALANLVIKDYLRLTSKEDDEVSRFIIAYYLVEKAVVRAAVSIKYDNLPEIGMNFLKVAEERLKELDDLLGTSIVAASRMSKEGDHHHKLGSLLLR